MPGLKGAALQAGGVGRAMAGKLGGKRTLAGKENGTLPPVVGKEYGMEPSGHMHAHRPSELHGYERYRGPDYGQRDPSQMPAW